MDSESQQLEKLETHPDTWNIDRIALFSCSQSADIFMKEVFPHFSHCIVVSADGVYPKNKELSKKARSALEMNFKLKVVVFNITALKSVPVLSERVFLMDELLMQGHRNHPADRDLGFLFSPEQLAYMMERFFTQWDRLLRIGNADFAYKNFLEYRLDDFDWRAGLVSQV